MARAKGGLSRTFVWIILGLLFIGLAGFGATGLSGTVRTIGSVGDKPITTSAYMRALQNELEEISRQTGQRVTLQQALAAGLDRNVVSQLVTLRALDHEADQMGLSVGDGTVAEELRRVPAFTGPDGGFDREAYRFALRNANMQEAEFEAQLREDTARTLLQGAILSGNDMPDSFTEALAGYIGEERGFAWAQLTEAALAAPIVAPDEAQLRAFYDENIARYTRPEARRITYAWQTPAMILDSVEVDEAALRAEYEARADEFNQPERRLVERLVFGNDAAATDARARLDAAEIAFDVLVEERGLTLSDIDLGDVAVEALGTAGEVVFAAEVGDVVGPIETDLGPALFRVNGVLSAQQTSFEDAEPQLRDELAQDRAVRDIEGRMEDLENLLAGGATLEDLALETGLEVGQITYYEGVTDGPAAYDAFRRAAMAVTADDFPEIDQLEDGGIFALRLDEVLPAAPRPYAEVAEQVAEDWRADAVTEALTAEAERLAERLRAGESFADLGLTPREEAGITRGAFIDASVPGLTAAAFQMEEGEVRIVPGAESVALVQLAAVNAPDMESDEMRALTETLRNQAQEALARDIYIAFATDIRNRAGISLDQSAINAVHAAFQ